MSFPASEARKRPQETLPSPGILAQRGIEGASREAEEYLRKAVKERPNDPNCFRPWALWSSNADGRKRQENFRARAEADPQANGERRIWEYWKRKRGMCNGRWSCGRELSRGHHTAVRLGWIWRWYFARRGTTGGTTLCVTGAGVQSGFHERKTTVSPFEY